MTTRGLGTFLVLEGAIVTCLLLARTGCLHLLAADALPGILKRRIERGNRVAPVVLALALLALAIGATLLVGA